MKPGHFMDSKPEPDTSAAARKKVPGRHLALKSSLRLLLFETASVLVVLGVALYFILGASAKGPVPASSSPFTSTSPSPTPASTQANNLPTNLPKLQLLSVIPDNSTAKISFKPFPGAKDYRVFDVTEPKVVKYAGMAHLEGGAFRMNSDGTPVFPFQTGGNGPSVLNIPYPQIEWNLLEDGQPHTLVVQAVNQLGPIPPGNLYNYNNGPLHPSNQKFSTLGMNEGLTPDGNDSINGQGPSTNHPKPIAQSAPFVVQANPNYHAIPSTSSATQTFFDTFADSEADNFKRIAYNPSTNSAVYTFNAGTNRAWTLQYYGADIRDSYPFISAGHFMDVLFDGGTPGTNWPLHTLYGYMNMNASQRVDFSSERVLHITMEVDLHQEGRRWTGIEVAPANDPLTNLGGVSGAINHSDEAFFFEFGPGVCFGDIFSGPSAGAGSDPQKDQIWGPDGQGDHICDLSNAYWGQAGINLDNRGKVDLFLSQTHAALFINGKLIIESDFPIRLPFTQAQVNFTHFVYHTENDHASLKQDTPYETYWLNYYQWSDERHWDNMGFEVLPAGGNSATWQKLVAGPHPTAPKLIASSSVSAPGSTAMADTPKNPPA